MDIQKLLKQFDEVKIPKDLYCHKHDLKLELTAWDDKICPLCEEERFEAEATYAD